MSRRFYIESPISGEQAVLSGAEAQHAARVLRVATGDRLTVFDGSGREWDAEVTDLPRGSVVVRLIEIREICRESDRAVTLAVALPKGDRQRWLIEKATELGVARLVPLRTERSVAQPKETTLKKLRRAVIEASKQCGRNRLLKIDEPRSIAEFSASHDERAANGKWVADPQGAACPPPDQQASVSVIIGPEGGLTATELAQTISAGWQPISLGPRILRIETAALALAARLCN